MGHYEMKPLNAPEARPDKKGQTRISNLQTAALALVVLVIIVAIGAQILGAIRDTQNDTTTEFNVTGQGLDALGTFGDFFAVIVIIVIAVVIIGLLVSAFRTE